MTNTLKMHHLVHDLALATAKTDDLSVNFDRQHVSNRVRHMLLLDPDLSMRYDHEHDMESLRSLSFQRAGEGPIAELVVKNFISSCQYRRSLDLSYSRFQVLPSRIGSLKQLRYLNLLGSENLKNVPDSICRLHNLQTLVLFGCGELNVLPKDIKYMVGLRVLWVTSKQISLPMNGIGCLRSLRSLCFSQRHNLQCLFEDMENLTALETLVIVECGSLRSLPVGVRNLTALKTLVIVKCEILNLMPEAINLKYNFDEEQRRWLRLQTLVLRGLPKLVLLPLWLLRGSANTLQSIAIGDCPNMSRLPDELWNFAAFTELNIENCPQLIETLKMRMDGIPPGIAHIPEIHLKC